MSQFVPYVIVLGKFAFVSSFRNVATDHPNYNPIVHYPRILFTVVIYVYSNLINRKSHTKMYLHRACSH